MSFEYPIDGLVIKVNQLDIQDKLGATKRAPRGMKAFKFNTTRAIKNTKVVRGKQNKIKSKMDSLYRDIEYYQDQYYNRSNSVIPDSAYDELLEELRNLENDYPEYKRINTPTERIAPRLTCDSKKQKHIVPMLSIDNINKKNVLESLRKFEFYVQKTAGRKKVNYVVEEKIDGIAVSLWYLHGKLYKAITRGDGIEGLEITDKASMIENLPHTLKGENIPAFLEIRGEIFMTYNDFEILNIYLRDNAKPYASPRDATSGTILQGNLEALDKRVLLYSTHSIGAILETVVDNVNLDALETLKNDYKVKFASTYDSMIKTFESWGLPVIQNRKVVDSIQSVYRLCMNRNQKNKKQYA